MTIRIKKEDIVWFFSFLLLGVLCLYRTKYVYGSFLSVLNIIDPIAFIWSIGLYIRHKMYKVKGLWIMTLMPLWFTLTTIINNADIKECTIMSYKMLATVYIVYYLLMHNRDITLRWLARFWTLVIMTEAFSCVTKCFGKNPVYINEYNFFLGMRVTIDQYIIYALFFNIMAVYVGGLADRIWFVLCIGSGVYFVIEQWVSTSILGMMVFFIIITGSLFFRSDKFFRYLAIGLLLFSVLFYFIQNYAGLQFIVENLLKKDLTFSGRTEIWTWVLKNIKGLHWVIGYGDIEQMSIPHWFSYTTHPHSNYLETLYKYGAVGLVMYLWMFKNMLQKIRYITSRKVRFYVIGSLAATMLMCIVSKNFWFMSAQIYYVVVMYGCEFTSADKTLNNNQVESDEEYQNNNSIRQL